MFREPLTSGDSVTLLLATTSALPAWFVLPLSAATILAIARHVYLIQYSDMPASRRRIRTANGLLMILVAGLLGYALGVMPSGPTRTSSLSEVRAFVTVWGLVIGFMPIIIGLGMLDAMNNVRLHFAARRGVREQLATKLAAELVVIARQRRRAIANTNGVGHASDDRIMDHASGGDA